MEIAIPFDASGYDAYITQLEDMDIGYVNEFDVEIWLPFEDGQPGGVVNIVEGEGAPPPAVLGRHIAFVLREVGSRAALVKVHGVPLPGWAVDLFTELRDELGGGCDRLDLLGVDGYRWESWNLRFNGAA